MSTENQISVQRALTELKSYEKKINSLTMGANFCVLNKPGKKINGLQTPDEFVKTQLVALNKISDIIAKKSLYKSLIYKANATTKVIYKVKDTLTEVTVADLIAKKEAAPFELALYRTILAAINKNKTLLQRESELLTDKASEFVKTIMGKEKATSGSSEESVKVMDKFIKDNVSELVSVLSEQAVSEKISELEDFLLEVDTLLSEANARTMISV